MKNEKPNSRKLHIVERIFLFAGGMVIASSLIVYAVSWNNLPITLSVIGITINQWFVAGFMVLTGIFAGTMIKSALIGRYRLD